MIVTKVVMVILMLLIVIGCIGLIMKFTDGFTSDFRTFYLTVDGKDIMTESNGYTLYTNGSMKVDVKYTFDMATTENRGYSIKVVPNIVEGKDFDFILDGYVYSYQAEKNLTEGFVIDKEDTSFTIKPKGNITDILRAIYPNNEISDCDDKSYEDMYSLVVTSYNGKDSVIINFSVIEDITGITLDKEEIVF